MDKLSLAGSYYLNLYLLTFLLPRLMPQGQASGLDDGQGLDGADEGAALAKDAVGEFGIITAH